jgi:hypothetical protein
MTTDQQEIQRLRLALEIIRDSTFRSAVALRGVADDALQIKYNYRRIIDDHSESLAA